MPVKIAEICSKCYRGLAAAGRPPEHQTAERARFQHAGERAVKAE